MEMWIFKEKFVCLKTYFAVLSVKIIFFKNFMAGIYIHIPFCATKCIYCDFFSVGSTPEKRAAYVSAVEREYAFRKQELGEDPIRTLYIGGGTPSLLSVGELSRLLSLPALADGAEVTVEMNPDDVTSDYVAGLVNAGVNRVSMGVQSFNDEELRFIRRRHDAAQAHRAVDVLHHAGIENISIDLIYGIPGQTLESWKKSLHEAVALGLPHLSAYSLTYEEGTRLTRMRNRGEFREVDENLSVAMFDMLAATLDSAGYEQYEISNFAKPGMRSRHNSAYWNFTPYLGLGAAAHSFDGSARRYNPSDLRSYMDKVSATGIAYEKESESPSELYNEYVMTRLRTREGVDLDQLEARFGKQCRQYASQVIDRYIADGSLVRENSSVHLTRHGVMLSDMIFRDLFIVE